MHPRPGCRLKVALSDALAAFLKVLDDMTLADLLGKSEHSILKFPRRSPVDRSVAACLRPIAA